MVVASTLAANGSCYTTHGRYLQFYFGYAHRTPHPLAHAPRLPLENPARRHAREKCHLIHVFGLLQVYVVRKRRAHMHLDNVIIQFDNPYDQCPAAHMKSPPPEQNKLLTSVRYSGFEKLLYTNQLY